MSEDLNTLIAGYLAKRREDDERLRAEIATQRHELEGKRRELLEALLGKALKEHWDTFTSGECRLEWGSKWGRVRNGNSQLVEIDEPIAVIVDTVTDARARFMLDDEGTSLLLRCRGGDDGYRYEDYRRPLVIYFAEEREKAELARKKAELARKEKTDLREVYQRYKAQDEVNQKRIEEAEALLRWVWPEGGTEYLYQIHWDARNADDVTISYALEEPVYGRWCETWRGGWQADLLIKPEMVIARLTLRGIADVPVEMKAVPSVQLPGVGWAWVQNPDTGKEERLAVDSDNDMQIRGLGVPNPWLMKKIDPAYQWHGIDE